MKKAIIGKLFDVLAYEKEEITSIYFYAIIAGLVQLSLPLGIQAIISFVLGGAISTSLVLLIILVILGVFITGLLQVNQMKLIEKIQQKLFVRYSFQYAHIIPKLNLKDIDSYYLPELVNRFFDTVSLQKGISKLLLDIPTATIQIIFGLVLLSFYHPVFILFGFALLTVLFLILRATGNSGLKTSLEESNYKYNVAGYLEELARMVTAFKFSNSNYMHLDKTDGFVKGYIKSRTAHFKILIFQYWTLIGFKVLITAAMLIVGTFLLINQQLNIGQFIAAEIVILLVIGSVEKLIVNLDKVYDVLTAIEKISKITEKPLEVSGTEQPKAGEKGLSVTANKLSFAYDDGKPALQDISFEVNAGEKVCIQGAHGSGKSTLLRLLSSAYTIPSGSLLINGISINNYDTQALRKQTGILLYPQEIFEGTLRENICMGDTHIDTSVLDKFAGIVGLKEFVDNHPDRYDMHLRTTGQRLSGRIIRKIQLIRALIHHPTLVLLEEPWAGLEETYQNSIRNYILNVLPVTVFVVSNDRKFAEQCDKRIILADGKIRSVEKKQ